MDLWRVDNVCIMNGVSVRFHKGMRIVGVMDFSIVILFHLAGPFVFGELMIFTSRNGMSPIDSTLPCIVSRRWRGLGASMYQAWANDNAPPT